MFYIKVPFSEKDYASKLGAKFDGAKKSWYVPDGVALEFFVKWIENKDLARAQEIIKSQTPEKGVTLTNLLTKVQQSIVNNLNGLYWVNAEIANLQQKGNTLYLQLVDLDNSGKQISNVRAVIWGDDLDFIKTKFKMETGFDFQKGVKVLIKASVSFHSNYHLSLIIKDVDPNFTLGGMESKIKKIRDKLILENIYNKNKNYIIPDYIKRIAVISPADAAGLGDFRSDAVKLENAGICSFKYYTATFQGEKTSQSITKEIKRVNYDHQSNPFDIIVIIRGGGSKTDLHFLNDYNIAKEIAQSLAPVIVGIGHERDRVIIDEVSNKYFDTPSKVINFISNNNINFIKDLNKNYEEIVYNKDKLIKDYINKIKLCYTEIELNKQNRLSVVKDIIFKLRNDIKELIYISKNNFKINLENINTNLKLQETNIINQFNSDIGLLNKDIKNTKNTCISEYNFALNKVYSDIFVKSPLSTLNNGYAIIKNNNNKVITSIKDIKKEKEILLMMKDGQITLKIGEDNGR